MKNQTQPLAEQERPDNSFVIIHDEGQSAIIAEAVSPADAEAKFMADNPESVVHGAARKSYIKMEWLGNTGEK